MDSQRGQSDLPADDKTLIVAETDSARESWMAIGPDERDEAVAIFQQLGEPDAEFARRAAARIRRLENARFRPRRPIEALTFSLPGRPIDIRVDFSAAAPVHRLRSVFGVPPALEPRRPLRTAEGWS